MPNDLIPGGEVSERRTVLEAVSPEALRAPAASDEPRTGFAPPFRALLGPVTPVIAVVPEPGQPGSGVLPTVPGYELLAELGRGGMGVVYKARHCSLKRLVALKMILAGLHADSRARLRFRTEAEAVARLQHPNIVQIHEVGEHDGRPFLSLEYLDGGNLQRQIAGVAQPEREAAQLVETLARAVHSMHEHGILHRDLKPTNILMSSDQERGNGRGGRGKPETGDAALLPPSPSALPPGSARLATPKITDFGLAKVLDADSGPTRTETLLGTPSYMAPEQAAGDTKNVGVAADVYSLGAILYEMLTGRPPFQGATPLKTLEQVRSQEPLPPRRWRRSLSVDLETICLKCLEKEPGRRYANAEALADDLCCFLEGRPIQARPIAAWQRLWRFARRHPAAVGWGLALSALACLVLIAWSYFQAADRLKGHQQEAKYQQFVRYRNQALVYGLLAPDEGSLFLGAQAAANLTTAEAAVRDALALAGMTLESESWEVAQGFPPSRQADIAADCYTLLLVLASVRNQEAMPLLERARRLGFRTQAFHQRRAYFLDQLGERERASQERAQAAALPPQGALDHFLVGEEQYRRGQWEPAMSSFHRALALQPGHFWAQFFLAVCHLKARNWEAAKAGLNACLSQQPDFVWAYLFRSFANEKLRAITEAEADFQKALELHPNEDARYVLHLERGILHFNQKELERAAADFRAGLALRPGQYNAYLNLAQVQLALGQFDEADKQMRTALKLQPPVQVVAGYHLERGRQFLRDQRFQEALQACEAALELSPHQPLPHEVQGRALLALKRYEQAEQSFDQYLREGGQENSDIFRGRGRARMKLGKYPEAVDDYTRVLEREPDAETYQHRGWAHFFADAWKLALRDFSTALERDPTLGDAYTGRGLARVMLGQDREAVADAEEALRRRPRTPEMMHNIACIFAQALAHAQPERPALADRYRQRALEAVRQTLALLHPEERLSFWQDKILPDAALAPIRDDVEFKKIQKEFAHSR